jgi:membrane-associated phospholipid phosphatase
MADLLRMQRADWWPVDKVILAYAGAAVALELIYWSSLPGPLEMLLVHLTGAILIAVAALYPRNVFSHVFHHWYPVFYVFYCYKEMSILIPALGRTDADAALARLDLAIWGANPTVWLERFNSPVLAEFLQIVYSGFVPAVLGIALVLWLQKRFAAFRYYAFLIALGFLASYAGYLLVPARGPRFLLHDLQTYELRGVFLYDWLRSTLDRIESAHYDCFPSGHTEMTVLAWWGSRTISTNLFRVMFVYTLGVIFATVYLRYHYTVDVLAGAIVAGVLIITAPGVYRALGGKIGEEAA